MCVVFELAELQVTAAARASKCSPADGEVGRWLHGSRQGRVTAGCIVAVKS